MAVISSLSDKERLAGITGEALTSKQSFYPI
jgi:hypothetical protein